MANHMVRRILYTDLSICIYLFTGRKSGSEKKKNRFVCEIFLWRNAKFKQIIHYK